MAYYQRQGLLLVVFKKNRACSLLFKRTTARPIISSSARVASLASSLLSTLREKTRIRPHRCAILQFMQFMGKKREATLTSSPSPNKNNYYKKSQINREIAAD